jgi:uncharacterized repeat protein (TIGR03803 family)
MTKLDVCERVCAVVVLLIATGIGSPAQTYTVLFDFDFTGSDGAQPRASLVQAFNGNLYGTTYAGGANGYGEVFQMTLGGTLTVLQSFDSTDGAAPSAMPVQAFSGDLYGTTTSGGTHGSGTIFKIAPNGAVTTLYTFCSQSDCTDGSEPVAPLVQAANGDLYGTTYMGGADNGGTVFKITPAGTLTTLYSFCSQSDCTDGERPTAGLIQAANGNLYGTTFRGATGAGSVFEITPGGTLTTLHSFDTADGADPTGELTQGNDGNLYGTTESGGAYSSGTVFKITPSGTLTTLYSFCSQSDCPDGENPSAGLVQATDGNLYGTTTAGGANVFEGTIFKITPQGTLTTIYSFCSELNCADGAYPGSAGLVQDTNGALYGTTGGGGASSTGTIFSLSVGLGAFVETRPTAGRLGAEIIILGNNLTGSTAVRFHGTAATFTVVSATEITATVPNGAATGLVEVTTPSGTLKSNVPFRVIP